MDTKSKIMGIIGGIVAISGSGLIVLSGVLNFLWLGDITFSLAIEGDTLATHHISEPLL